MTMTGDKEKISAKLLIPEANNITIKVSFKNKWKGSSRLARTWFGYIFILKKGLQKSKFFFLEMSDDIHKIYCLSPRPVLMFIKND